MVSPQFPLIPRDPENSRLHADDETLDLSIYVLSQTRFCPRAGLLTRELIKYKLMTDNADDVQEDRSPRLDWLPDYDDALIREQIDERVSVLTQVAPYAIVYSLAWFFIVYFYRGIGLVLAAPIVVFAFWLWDRLQKIRELERRIKAFDRASNNLKISDLGKEEQTVNWWSLRKAGFSVSSPEDPNVYKEWKLGGRPFLVLTYQGMRIPVLRKHRGREGVFPNNRAAIVGYCHLLEKCEGAQSPFGVMMFADTYEVVIVPNNHANQLLFEEGLLQTREILRQIELGMAVGEPTRNQCRGCPLGKPRKYEPGKSDKHIGVLPGSLTVASKRNSKQQYHCVCGDRFGWLPPHENAVAMDLKR